MDESLETTSACRGTSPTGQPEVDCCKDAAPGPARGRQPLTDEPWAMGVVHTPVGPTPQVATTLSRADRIGSWKARWAMRRMAYRVEPGLYAAGSPRADSPVFVSANYKMSFDRLRSQLGGHHPGQCYQPSLAGRMMGVIWPGLVGRQISNVDY